MCVQRESGGGPFGPSTLVELDKTGYKPSLLNWPTVHSAASCCMTRTTGSGPQRPHQHKVGLQRSAPGPVTVVCILQGHGVLPAPTPSPDAPPVAPPTASTLVLTPAKAPPNLLLCPEGHLLLNLSE